MTFLTACCRWQICRVRTEIVIHPRATCTRNVWPSVSQTTSSGTAAAETFICPVRKHYCCHSWIVNSMDLFEVVKVVKTLGLSPHSTRIDNNLGNLCDCNSKLFTDMIACRANCPFFILSEWVLFISPPPGGVCTMLLQQVGGVRGFEMGGGAGISATNQMLFLSSRKARALPEAEPS